MGPPKFRRQKKKLGSAKKFQRGKKNRGPAGLRERRSLTLQHDVCFRYLPKRRQPLIIFNSSSSSCRNDAKLSYFPQNQTQDDFESRMFNENTFWKLVLGIGM